MYAAMNPTPKSFNRFSPNLFNPVVGNDTHPMVLPFFGAGEWNGRYRQRHGRGNGQYK